MPAPTITLRPGNVADIPRLISVWRSSVDATHHFVLPADLDYYEARMADVFSPDVALTVAEVEGEVVGFCGTVEQELAMLFVDAPHRGIGVGTALIRDVIARISGLVLDVNEQNEQAVGFYFHHGFRVVGRSPVDGYGKPYPLLHLAHMAETGSAGTLVGVPDDVTTNPEMTS